MGHFDGLGDIKIDPQAQALRDLSETLEHWARTTEQMLHTIALYVAAHGLPSLIAAATADNEAKLRLVWPVLKAAKTALGSPDNVPDLPA